MQVKIYFVFSKRALNIYGTHSIALYRLGYLLIYLSYFFIEREGCIEPKNGESPTLHTPEPCHLPFGEMVNRDFEQ